MGQQRCRQQQWRSQQYGYRTHTNYGWSGEHDDGRVAVGSDGCERIIFVVWETLQRKCPAGKVVVADFPHRCRTQYERRTEYLELLLLIDAAKRASASRVTAVLPYYGYARQERKDQPRVSIAACSRC